MAAVIEQTFDAAFEHADTTNTVELVRTLIGVEPELVQDFDLTLIDPSARVQVRIDKNNAPKEMVERYAGQMSFSAFPPPVFTLDPLTVDGNTRVAARKIREERFTPALVIPVRWQEADDDMKRRLVFLGETLNNTNGKPLDRAERREMVRNGLELGLSTKQVSQTVGFPINTVNKIRLEVAGEEKLDRVGLSDLKLSDASLRALGKAADLNDQPFHDLAMLVRDSAFTSGETTALAASVRETGSDQLGVERIAREREANAQRIADLARGEQGKPPAARVLRQRLGFVVGREPRAFIETNREQMQEHLDLLEQSVVILNDTINQQRALIQS